MFIKSKKSFFVVWIVFYIVFLVGYCYFTNKYDVAIEVRDGEGKGDWHYEHIYYSVSEATLNNLKDNWLTCIIIGGITFFVLLSKVADDIWDQENKNRYGEGFTYWQRRDIDTTLGIDRFGVDKKKRK